MAKKEEVTKQVHGTTTQIVKPGSKVPKGQVEVTHDNAPKLTVHFLSMIHGRLGYMIKLLEEKKKK